MRIPRTLLVASAAVLTVALSGCSSGQGSAFGYGQGDGNGSISGEPIAYGRHAVIGISLDNRTDESVELLSMTPLQTSNVTVGRSYVAPVLQERDGSWLSFGVNQPTDTPTLVKEWALRRPAAGYRIVGRQKNLQGLVEVSVRDDSRPAQVIAVVIRYLQGGRTVTETTNETACFFPAHRASVCTIPH